MNNVIANRFDITSDDIALLGDADLRELVGRLCEADCHVSNINPTSVTYGGHQDAPDGGIDVSVSANQSFSTNVSIPRSYTGFQVKKPSMARTAILNEIKPNGVLRPSIQTLINNNGAYIIISSGDSVTDSSLKDRIDAMKEATTKNFHVDFFDRNRIATWVRTHPSLILWVRGKIGRSLTGWQPYSNWAKTVGGTDEEYLIDDGLRLRDDTQNHDPKVSIQDGMARIRQRLIQPRTFIRLVGLSGVGKTRLVQALFDNRIGGNALPQNIVFYADMSDGPNPSPEQLVDQLIAENARALLIVDNCSPELHKKLSFTCSSQNSHLSLLTVEYDVRNEDFSDETNVFHLEPSSDELIKELILKRFSHINQVDAGTISEASGGNYRIAIALATTVKKGDSLTGLTDIQLFKKLFEQQQGKSDDLLQSASALSLVYSFNGEDTLSDQAELKVLSSLVNKQPLDIYRDTAELQRRDLVQNRSVWRAVLPQAVANMLAKHAVESIPKDTIVQAFLNNGSERLIRSFSRRLGYLHNVPQALSIIQNLLAENGWIGDVRNLNKFGMDVFENLASAAPKEALEAIERAAKADEDQKFLTRDNPHFYYFVQILRSIAYEVDYFQRCVLLICEIALTENENNNNNSTRSILKSLFYTYLSGTQAEEDKRLGVIESLIESDDEQRQSLGLMLLDVTLEAWHFSSSYGFSFGGRKRGYGYYPRGEQITKWYHTFISAAEKIALSNDQKSDRARKVLADRFRGLWTSAQMFDVLEKVAINLHKSYPWNEGWVAIREALKFDKDKRTPKITARLEELEKALSPNDLEQRCRVYIFSGGHTIAFVDDLDDDGNVSAKSGRAEEIVFDLGVQLGNNQEVFEKLLGDLILPAQQGAPNHFSTLGRGLAQVDNKKEIWVALKEQLLKTEAGKQNPGVLIGMVLGARQSDPNLAESWLDEVLQDAVLGRWLPCFQSPIDQRGLERLNEALDKNISDLWFYQQIAYGRAHEAISDDDLAGLIKKIAPKENGHYVALEILNMRFFRTKSEKEDLPPHSESLFTVARELLVTHPFTNKNHRANSDHNLSRIAKECLKGEGGAAFVSELSKKLVIELNAYKIYSHDYPQLLNRLAEAQPKAFLDVFFKEEAEGISLYRIFFHDFGRDRNPIDHITDDALISWCEENPEKRYPFIASTVKAFDDPEGKNIQAQWRPITQLLFEKAPDLEAVLTAIAENIRPSGWGGSLATILQRRLSLFPQLFNHQNSCISAWAKNIHENLQISIPKITNQEMEQSRERDEKFEW